MQNYYVIGDSLAHYGIKGQKWGVRRFQNPDGTWTAAGRARYGRSSGSISGGKRRTSGGGGRSGSLDARKSKWKKIAKGAAIGLGAAAAIGAGAYLYKNRDKISGVVNDIRKNRPGNLKDRVGRKIDSAAVRVGMQARDAMGNARGAVNGLRNRAGDFMDRAGRKINSTATRVGMQARETMSNARGAVNDFRNRAGDFRDRAGRKINSTATRVGMQARDVMGNARGAVNDLRNRAGDFRDRAGRKVDSAAVRAGMQTRAAVGRSIGVARTAGRTMGAVAGGVYDYVKNKARRRRRA